MVTEVTNKIADNEALLPERHPQQELFLCDIADAVLKDDMASMEHPFFSLSKKPDHGVRVYEHGNARLEVRPSLKGLATIYDKDILIYAISQLIAGKNTGKEITQIISMTARDLLIFTNRHTGGRDYELLGDALERLQGTQIKTNIKTGGEEQVDLFSLVDSATLVRNEDSGRITELRIKLSDWVFNVIESKEVLTLSRDYFRLRKPLERRIYEIARKHCGAQAEWKVNLALLKKKCGSNSPLKHFRYLLRDLVKHDHLPDYSVRLGEEDMVMFRNRRLVEEITAQSRTIWLDAETYNDARSCAPGWDIYVLEEKWRTWMINGGLDAPKNADKAFLGFCRKWFENHGTPP